MNVIKKGKEGKVALALYCLQSRETWPVELQNRIKVEHFNEVKEHRHSLRMMGLHHSVGIIFEDVTLCFREPFKSCFSLSRISLPIKLTRPEGIPSSGTLLKPNLSTLRNTIQISILWCGRWGTLTSPVSIWCEKSESDTVLKSATDVINYYSPIACRNNLPLPSIGTVNISQGRTITSNRYRYS